MNNLREASKQALEVLERAGEELRWQAIGQVQRDLRAALAEPEQEPLTDEEIDQIAIKCLDAPEPGWNRNLARAIEWAHGIR